MPSRIPEWKFLSLTAVAVALLGFQTVRDAFQGGEELHEVVAFAAHEDNASPVGGTSSREPSSVKHGVSMNAALPLTKEVLLEWNWNCRDHASEVADVQGPNFRLKGHACKGEFSPDRLLITNESNGFTASVFDKGSQSYETDLIQLQQGANTIRLQYRNSSGEKVESILTVHSSEI